MAPVLPLLAVAAACWYLTFAASRPVWEAVPGLPLLQFPWRLFGPLGICLAVAGAGALAPLLRALERRWPRRGPAAGHALVALVAGGVLFNSLGDREFQFSPHPERVVDGRTVVLDEARDNNGAGTTSNREFLSRDVQVATYTGGYNRVRAAFLRLYPEPDWTGGLFYALGGDLRLLGWRSQPLRLAVRVANDGAEAAPLGIRQVRFPGWRAWLDGRPVSIGTPPYNPQQQASLGFMVIDVPPGEHTISLAFGPTPLRLAAMGLSLATSLLAVAAGAWALRRVRRWPPAALGAAALLLAAGLGYLTWRGVRPMFGRFALPAAAAAPSPNGVWSAPDLDRGGAGMLVNLAEAVRTGRARVDSPTGQVLGPGRFLDVRPLTVVEEDQERGAAGASRRQWLYMHPPSAVTVDVAIPRADQVWLQAGLTLDPEMWAAPTGDGVRFQAAVAPLDSAGREGPHAVVLDHAVNPRARTEQRRWVPVEADLSAWRGQTVRLTLRTLLREDPTYDWSGWADPVIFVRQSARERPPFVPP